MKNIDIATLAIQKHVVIFGSVTFNLDWFYYIPAGELTDAGHFIEEDNILYLF